MISSFLGFFNLSFKCIVGLGDSGVCVYMFRGGFSVGNGSFCKYDFFIFLFWWGGFFMRTCFFTGCNELSISRGLFAFSFRVGFFVLEFKIVLV